MMLSPATTSNSFVITFSFKQGSKLFTAKAQLTPDCRFQFVEFGAVKNSAGAALSYVNKNGQGSGLAGAVQACANVVTAFCSDGEQGVENLDARD